MRKKITAIVALMAMLVTAVLPLDSYAWYSGRPQITTAYTYETATEMLTHNGLVWNVDTTSTKTTTRTSDNGTRYNYDDDTGACCNNRWLYKRGR